MFKSFVEYQDPYDEVMVTFDTEREQQVFERLVGIFRNASNYMNGMEEDAVGLKGKVTHRIQLDTTLQADITTSYRDVLMRAAGLSLLNVISKDEVILSKYR